VRTLQAFDGPRPKDEPAADVKAIQVKIGYPARLDNFLRDTLIASAMLSAKR